MFTGIVEEMGVIREKIPVGPAVRFRFAAPGVAQGLKPGDSVSCNGVCLTAETVFPDGFTATAVCSRPLRQVSEHPDYPAAHPSSRAAPTPEASQPVAGVRARKRARPPEPSQNRRTPDGVPASRPRHAGGGMG